MKAWMLHGIGDLAFEEVDTPALKSGEAMIKVYAVGICSSDIQRVYKSGAYYYPIILGHEFAGVVEAVADIENSAWVGKRVSAFPLIPCKQCEECIAEHYETCSNYDYIGSRSDGAFAEYIAVPIWNLIEIPSDVEFRLAAMLEPAAVALHAVRQGYTLDVRSALIIGSGTIGLLIADWLRSNGVERIYVQINKAEQGKLVDELGFKSVFESPVVDLAFDAVGSDIALARCIEVTRPNGRIVVVGNPSGSFKLEKDVYWKVLRKQLSIAGSWNSSFSHSPDDDWNTALAEMVCDKLHIEQLISHEFNFDEADKAFAIGKEKTNPFRKLIVNYYK